MIPVLLDKKLKLNNSENKILDRELTDYINSVVTIPTSSSIYINVKDNSISNLTGDGITDDSAAFDALIDGVEHGDTLYFPSGNYIISGVQGSKRVNLLGSGSATIINTSATYSFIPHFGAGVATAKNYWISNLIWTGDKTVSGNFGLAITESRNWTIQNCRFSDFDDGGFYVANSPADASQQVGGNVIGCYARDCNVGFNIDSRGEYVNFIGGSLDNNVLGVRIKGGNNTLSGVNINYNTTGINVIDGNNSSKGIIVGCRINHNTTALDIDDADFGYNINANNFFANIKDLDLHNSNGILVNGNSLDGDIDINDTKVLFSNNLFNIPVTVTKTGVNVIQDINNFDFDLAAFAI